MAEKTKVEVYKDWLAQKPALKDQIIELLGPFKFNYVENRVANFLESFGDELAKEALHEHVAPPPVEEPTGSSEVAGARADLQRFPEGTRGAESAEK